MRTIILKIQETELSSKVYLGSFEIFKNKKEAQNALINFYKQNKTDYYYYRENGVITNSGLFQKQTIFIIICKDVDLWALLKTMLNLPNCKYAFNEVLKMLRDNKIEQSLIFEKNG
jgi:hypothetical protein